MIARRAPDARLATGIAGIAVAALLIAEFLVRTSMGARPELDDTAALAQFVTRTSGRTLTIILIDTIMMAWLVVFLSGFRQIVVAARRDLEWVATIAVSAGLVFVGITLIGDALEGGGALDSVGRDASPTVIRALTEGYLLLFGPTGSVLLALVAGSSGYVILASNALPRWTGGLAVAVAVLNVGAIPSTFGGTSDRSFYSVAGWGVTAFATFPWMVWVVVVSVCVLIARRRARRA